MRVISLDHVVFLVMNVSADVSVMVARMQVRYLVNKTLVTMVYKI